MLLSRLIIQAPTGALGPSIYLFSRATSKSSKQKYETKSADFESLQSEYAKDYFENYRKEVEKDTVIRDFRKQIFNRNSEAEGMVNKLDQQLDEQQNKINRLLNTGNRDDINKYSKKVMQHVFNNRSMFKGKENKDVFKDYANYSAYKTNYVTIEDRNYTDDDMLNRSKTESRTYEFIESLPDQYEQKIQVRRQIQEQQPIEAANLTISQYGKRLQKKHDLVQRADDLRDQMTEQNSFKIVKGKSQFQETIYESLNNSLDVDREQTFQLSVLSTDAMNKIYDLYLQGWSVREISRRFGILPARAKFHIWARARLYNELVPKYGLKFLLQAWYSEAEEMSTNDVLDYGMDLAQMTKTDRYQQIVGWENERVDVQRTPDKYTRALQKLEKVNKFNGHDTVQVGTFGKQNKKHMLKDWKIYRGKKSDEYFLKNKVFRKLMEENRKIKAVYY